MSDDAPPPHQTGSPEITGAPTPAHPGSAFPWDRVFELINRIDKLTPEQAESELRALAAAGEPALVLARVRIHLGIPPASDSSGELTPDTIVGGEYRIVRRLGSGGMGVVYEAVLEKTGQTVALKMIQPGLVQDHLRARFLSEMKMLGQLDHPGIVQIRHAGYHVRPDGTGSEFFTMECIVGSSPLKYLKDAKADWIERLRVIRDAAIAVQYAHDRSVIHRDLKPGNMMISNDGQVVLFDFGLSAALASGDDSHSTPGPEGTPPYMAPEQADGVPPTPAADIYSLGAMLHEFLTGAPLYHLNPLASRSAILDLVRHPPPRLAPDLPDAPPVLCDILDKALSPDPEERYPSAAAFVRAINRILPDRLVHEPPHKWHPAAGVAIPATDWVLEEKLGDGAHGQVWLARNRPVLKSSENALIPPPRVYKFCASDDAARSLRREQRVFLALKRAADAASASTRPGSEIDGAVSLLPGIVPLEAWSLDEPPYYIAMRWIESVCDLHEWLRKFTPETEADLEAAAISIVITVAGALQFASQNGVLHRDVSPANILVANDPGAPGGVRAWLVDFGLAAFDPNFARSLLSHSITDKDTARLVGSPEYIAPEIKRGIPATTRSDLYSLGVVLYRLLRRDLTATLTEWKQHIADPFLQEDLKRCLADKPEDRFNSAAELAESLQKLTERREAAAEAAKTAAAAEAEAEAITKARERIAYRRGIFRTLALAATIVAGMSVLTLIAIHQKKEATKSRTQLVFEQIESILKYDQSPDRRKRLNQLMEEAAATGDDATRLQSLSSRMFGISDLVPLPAAESVSIDADPPLMTEFPTTEKETARSISNDGRTVAIARDSDGLSGTIDLIDTGSRKVRMTLDRKSFPWMPVVESTMLQFSQDDSMIAVAGPATSKHVLVFSTVTGRLAAYLFHGRDPSAMAWHPAGRLLASGSPDGIVRIWDLAAATDPRGGAPAKNDFDLPPMLSDPALDIPLCTLQGHRSQITALCFDRETGMLISSDSAGYLRLWNGFNREGMLGLVEKREAMFPASRQQIIQPTLNIETRTNSDKPVLKVDSLDAIISLHLADGSTISYEYQPTQLPAEIHLSSNLTGLDWHPTEPEVCVINENDIFRVSLSPLRVLDGLTGKDSINPVSVAYDPITAAWAVPNTDQYCQIKPAANGGRWINDPRHCFEIKPPNKDQGFQTRLAATTDGRAALYCGRHIQFVRAGQLASTRRLKCQTEGGLVKTVQWDPSGRLLFAAFQMPGDRVSIESWSTSEGFPPVPSPFPVHTVIADSIVPTHDGSGILIRSVADGLGILDPSSGSLTKLDSSAAARQAYPMALSHDGRVLASIADRQTIHLFDLPKRRQIGVITSPRETTINAISWQPFDAALATLTADGYLQHWNLQPWLRWLEAHGLGR